MRFEPRPLAGVAADLGQRASALLIGFLNRTRTTEAKRKGAQCALSDSVVNSLILNAKIISVGNNESPDIVGAIQ